MKLTEYVSKRDLKKSPEPAATIPKKQNGELKFVVQKHDASHLHYDFRLEVDGVLKSWAIPKGPSVNPAVKRLAMMVEDHPYDYREFEGIIPEGYGAGTVMIWDQGSYSVDEKPARETEEHMRQGLEKGTVHFTLNGEKLKGEFALVKLKNAKKNEWIFLKKKDSYASEEEVLLQDRSVVSGRDLDEIASNKKSKSSLNSSQEKSISKKQKIKHDRKPQKVKPMLATLVDKPFDDNEWIYEIKLDGFRAIAELSNDHVELYSRNLLSFNKRFPSLIKHLQDLSLDAVFDGEIVALNSEGISQFQKLQNEVPDENLYFYVFDILYLNGEDLQKLPLTQRKDILSNILKKDSAIRYLDHISDKGLAFFKFCEEKGLEGMVAKKKESPYLEGVRSKSWLKIKNEHTQEVVICGFTEPKRGRKNFGALMTGIYKGTKLTFSGRVGGGVTEKKLKEMKDMMLPHVVKECPLNNIPKPNSDVTWIAPKFVCDVKFKEMTDEGIMRQPIFLGLRPDKSPSEVVEEKPESTTEIKKISAEVAKEKPTLANEVKNIPSKTSTKKNTSKKNLKNGSSEGKKLLDEYDFLTNLDKPYWDKENITKGDVLNYYASIAKYILPYLLDRPQVLKRYPHGISQPNFYQKNLESHPDWISTTKIQHENKLVEYLLIPDTRSLLYAVNLGCIEIHSWFSKIQHLENPDILLIDLDPEDISFDAVVETANVLHSILEELKVPHFCKTSGATGMHIGVPLGGKYSFEQAKQFALLIANLATQQLPKITSLERKPINRQKKVYIDCLQNNFGQTMAMPFSIRAREGAPVSTPLDWSEVKKGLDPGNYTIFNMLERFRETNDFFKGVLKTGMDLGKVLKKINLFNR
ncbi:MAG: DNA ligase D [Parachlamydiaceae bacterium]|nr:DNA ligase D [Parachlamydiaceae bacterium]